ncbi:putative powdery mildew resistance protein, RPW8 [Helianthus debilis subsp. tardiflorus]
MLRESSRLSRVLDHPENETKMFIFHLERGKELVVKCSRIKFWNVYQKFVYSNKIIRLNNEPLMFFKIDLPEIMMSTGMRSLVGIYDLADKMDQVLSVATHVRANRGLCGVPEIVNFYKGLPLALTVAGASLGGQPAFKWKTILKKWSESGSMLQSNSDILHSLKSSVDALDELPNVKECFLDLGSFPEDERVSATVLMDMWVVLYNLDDEGTSTSENLHELSLRNLITTISPSA